MQLVQSGKLTAVTLHLCWVFCLAASLSAATIPEDADAVAASPTTIGYNWTVLMEDQQGTIVQYSRDPERPLIPASNTKIFTTAAAFELLGKDHVFETDVFHTGTLSGPAGSRTLTGDLILIVKHDPTWNSSTLSPTRAGLDRIASRVRTEAGITTIVGRAGVYGASSYGLGSTSLDHWNVNSSQASQNSNTATSFRAALIAQGVSVSETSVLGVYSFAIPGTSTFLFTHRSSDLNYRFGGQPLTLEVACIPLNKVSHNAMADLLLRHIAWNLDTQNPPRDSYAVGESFVVEWVASSVGADTTGMRFFDGSGIDGRNRASARQTVEVTRHMVESDPDWAATLPISGVDGTISSRLGGSLAGRVHAKTGTLPNTGSVSLSGYVEHPIDARRYYFSIIVNTPSGPISTTGTRDAIDDMVRVLGDRRPPFSPDLYTVRNSNGGLDISWTDNAFETTGYRLYRSEQGGPAQPVPQNASPYIIESAAGGLNTSDYTEVGTFESSSSHSTAPGLTTGIGSRFVRPTNGAGRAVYTPGNLAAGRYRVDVTCFDFSSAKAPGTTVRFVDALGTRTVQFELSDQTAGNVWRSVGVMEFRPGSGHRVEFDNSTQLTTGDNDRLNAAAVRFVPLFHRIDNALDGLHEFHVTALGRADGESPISDAYAARVGAGAPVLVVDGFDRWVTQADDNPTGLNHRFATLTGESTLRPFDSAANEAVKDGAAPLSAHRIVVWVSGEEGTADRSFDEQEQGIVADHLAAGRHLFVSGAEIAWELGRATGPTPADRAFLNNVLRVTYEADDALTYAVNAPTGIFAGIPAFDFDNGSGGTYNVAFPDAINPNGPGASTVMTYGAPGTGNAAIIYDGSAGGGRIVFLGFPFDTIIGKPTRDEIMARALAFFDEQAAGQELWMVF